MRLGRVRLQRDPKLEPTTRRSRIIAVQGGTHGPVREPGVVRELGSRAELLESGCEISPLKCNLGEQDRINEGGVQLLLRLCCCQRLLLGHLIRGWLIRDWRGRGGWTRQSIDLGLSGLPGLYHQRGREHGDEKRETG